LIFFSLLFIQKMLFFLTRFYKFHKNYDFLGKIVACNLDLLKIISIFIKKLKKVYNF